METEKEQEMSQRETGSGWRCPYCDALNDWQDSVCQICGDGRRDEPEQKQSAERESSAARGGTAEHESSAARGETTGREDSAKRERPPEYIPFGESKPRHPEAAKPTAKPQKKHRLRKLLTVVLVLCGLLYAYCFVSARGAADRIDLELMADLPTNVSDVEVAAWLAMRGFEVEPWRYNDGYSSGISEGYYFVDDPAMEPGDYSIIYHIEEGSYFMIYMGLKVPLRPYWKMFYNRLTERMKQGGWKKITTGVLFEEDPDNSQKMSVWQAENGSICYLSCEGDDFWDKTLYFYKSFRSR